MNKDNKNLSKKSLLLLPVLALAFTLAFTSGALAKDGADDAPGDVKNSGTDDNKSDDGASKQRHTGLDDNKPGDGARQARGTGDDDAAKGRVDDNPAVSNSSRGAAATSNSVQTVNDDANKVDDNVVGVEDAQEESIDEDNGNDLNAGLAEVENEPAHVEPVNEDKGVLASMVDSVKSFFANLF